MFLKVDIIDVFSDFVFAKVDISIYFRKLLFSKVAPAMYLSHFQYSFFVCSRTVAAQKSELNI